MEVKTKKRIKKICLIVIAVLIALALLLAGTYVFMLYRGKSQFHNQDNDISVDNKDITVDTDENTVFYKDEAYKLNENIVSVLVMGIDKQSVGDNSYFGQNGQADSIFVATVDTDTKKVKIIPIPRETMVDVNVYSKSGVFAETKRQQLCLAYAYGDTAESSSQNVLRSVRRALYGINISSYITVDLHCVNVLSTKVGGVTVNCLETLKNTPFVEGKSIKLKGENAVKYIQARGDDELGSSRRLARQKQFLSAFLSTSGNQILNDFSMLTKFYNAAQPYISTDLTFAQITYLASSCLSKDIGSSIEYADVAGTYTKGQKWMEFEQDEDQMIKTVMETFYVKAE